MRSALAVLAGFATWTVLFLATNQITSRVFSDRFDENLVTTDPMVLALTLALTVAFSVLAGWVAGYHLTWAAGIFLGLCLEALVCATIGVALREGNQFGAWQSLYPLLVLVIFALLLQVPATRAKRFSPCFFVNIEKRREKKGKNIERLAGLNDVHFFCSRVILT